MSEWLTTSDIVKMTGLKYDTLYQYRKRRTLPDPDHYVGRTPLWKKDVIEDWEASRRKHKATTINP